MRVRPVPRVRRVPRFAGLLAVAFAMLVLAAACGPAPTGSPTTASTGPAPSLESPVVGVITHVESQGLDQVTAFSLRTDAGTIVTFRIGTLENGDEFPPGHLTEHQATSEPVRVFFRVEGAELVATRLEDGGG